MGQLRHAAEINPKILVLTRRPSQDTHPIFQRCVEGLKAQVGMNADRHGIVAPDGKLLNPPAVNQHRGGGQGVDGRIQFLPVTNGGSQSTLHPRHHLTSRPRDYPWPRAKCWQNHLVLRQPMDCSSPEIFSWPAWV